MIRELIWITFAALVFLAPVAEAKHTIRHSVSYCGGLVAMASHVLFLKQLDASRDDVLAFIAAVGADYGAEKAVIETWQKDAVAMYDASDSGMAHIEACYADAAKPDSIGI